MMCSECLVILSDPLTFEVTDIHKYLQIFTKFIGPDIAVKSLFTSQLIKSELTAISGPINFVKICKYLCRSTISKVDGSLRITKHSEHIITLFFQKYENLGTELQQH